MIVKTPKDRKREFISFNYNVRWNPSYFTKLNNQLKYTIEGVAEYSKDLMNNEYVPKRSGNLIDSSEIYRVSDSQVNIRWRAPYAMEKYYDKSEKIVGKRGPMWFERMMNIESARIGLEARRIFSKGGNLLK